MDHRRFFRVLSFLLIFALLAGAFALAEEDVSITIYDNQGNVVAGPSPWKPPSPPGIPPCPSTNRTVPFC